MQKSTVRPTPLVIGLTGGIGSGKTVVSDYFAEIGIPVIDTDVIARTIVEPGQPALTALVAAFGDDILLVDGHLDRASLRNIAFSNDANKAQLDSITHPAIRRETLRQLELVSYPYCIVVVPLLVPDSGFNTFVQRILVVTADHQTRIERVKKRSNLSTAEIEKIMRSQLQDAQRLDFADDVIVNDGSIAEVHAQVEGLHQLYLELSQAH